MSLKWFCGFALLLSVALPVTALAESENGERRLRPNSSVVNIFGWGKNQKAIMRQVDVREYDPETSISGEADPSPSQRLIPIPATEGNLTYIPEKLEPLRDRKLKEQRPADLYAAALFDELQSDNPAASVLAAERKVILDHYRDTAFKPLWTTPAGISERGREVLALFKGAPDEGLDTADYELHVLGGFDAPPNSFANDPVHLARLDIELTARAMAYARHASGGRLIPDRLTTYNDIAAPRIDPAEAMRMLAVTPFAASWLKSLHPTHPAYAAFKTELANLRKLAADTAQMPILPGKRLKLGQSDDRLPILRQHLQRLGHLKSETPDLSVLPHHIQEHARSAASIGLTFMDVDVSNALKAFQKAHNLKQTRHPGSADDSRPEQSEPGPQHRPPDRQHGASALAAA